MEIRIDVTVLLLFKVLIYKNIFPKTIDKRILMRYNTSNNLKQTYDEE